MNAASVACRIRVAAALGCLGACSPVPDATPRAAAEPVDVARGRYLASVADCAGCHTAPGAPAYAGGTPLATPFGTVYAPNITPDREHGIGRWTAADFYRALHDGISPRVGELYPAMPYPAYRGMSRQDVDDLYAFLRSVPPAPTRSRDPELRWPFDVRVGMRAWNALYLDRRPAATSIGTSAAWERGRYLVEAVAHCDECHAPRGALGELRSREMMSGYALGRFRAPDITAAGLAQRGWTPAELERFLRTGRASLGTAFADMATVVELSTSRMTAADRQAMVTYLLGERPAIAPPAESAPLPPAVAAAGRAAYQRLCSGCHGVDGEGRPGAGPALAHNSTVREAHAHNVVTVMLDGLPARTFVDGVTLPPMPGFATVANDDTIAALASWLRVTWGGWSGAVPAAYVRSRRATSATPADGDRVTATQ